VELRARRHWCAVLSGGLIVVLAASACSSASSGSGAATAPSSASAPAHLSAANFATAKSVAAEAEKQPVNLELGANPPPITKPIPKGKRIDFLTCASPGCVVIAKTFEQAATKLGWTYKLQTVEATPTAVQNAFDTAVRDKPDGVAVVAVPTEDAPHQLSQLKAMNIPVVVAQSPDVKSGPIIVVLYNHVSANRIGKISADYMMAKGCTNGTTLYAQVAGFQVLVYMLSSAQAEFKAMAPGAKIQVLNIAATQEATAPAAIVSAVRANSSIDCIYISSDPMGSGLPEALKAAGIQKSPMIFTSAGGQQTLQYIKDGQMQATQIGALGDYGWLYADTFARYFSGQSVAPDAAALESIWMVNQSNAPATFPYSNTVNMQAKYLKLWGLK
jgi:ABC-type sugar transport system substrate-binding protein